MNHSIIKRNLSSYDISFGKQIDYNSNSNNHLDPSIGENLILASHNHPTIILEYLEEDDLVLCVFGTSIKTRDIKDRILYDVEYNFGKNDLVLEPTLNNGLTERTLFRMHAKNINLLEFNTEFFIKNYNKTSKIEDYVIGSLSDDERSRFKNIYDRFPQIQNILTELKSKEIQFLGKDMQDKKEFKMKLTTAKYTQRK